MTEPGGATRVRGLGASAEPATGCAIVLAFDECGDGFLAGGEQCDDDNTDHFDGCSSSCQIERSK